MPRAQSGSEISIGGTVNVKELAHLLHVGFGWGVVVTGDGDSAVGSGTYSGTLTDIVDDVAAANDLSISWDDTNLQVELTVN